MSDVKHTQEPWVTDSQCGFPQDVHDANGKLVAACIDTNFGEAHAHRIVACVNACAGMTNEQLDNICLISGSLLNRFGEQAHYLGQVEKQRDELLAALEKIGSFTLSQFMGPHDMSLECVNVASAAIASVKGGAA